jgi:extracellular elastinolytic metalloproteinase
MALTSAAALAVVAALAAPQAVADARGTPAARSAGSASLGEGPAVRGRGAVQVSEQQKARQSFDSRRDGRAGAILQRRHAKTVAQPPRAVVSLKRSLGVQGLVSIDPLTGSPRQVARVDGFLTGRSKARPKTIALRYVEANRAAFGLSRGAIRSLTLRRDYRDVGGTHHLSFVQRAKGIPVFGNGLVAHVAKDGRLIGFTGSPLTSVAGLPAARPAVSAASARSAAIRDVGGRAGAQTAKRLAGAQLATRFAGGDRASLVWFRTTAGTVLAWQTQVKPASGQLYTSVVDAGTGRVLYRDSLVDSDTALVWENYPGAPRGGTQRRVTLPRRWLPKGSVVLQGRNAHVFTDVDDNNAASTTEEVRPTSPGRFEYRFTPFGSTISGMSCTTAFPCSWDPNVRNSWRTNAGQNATQVFYFLNKFHDHLAASPIGFTDAAGNFEGVDAVDAQPLDGANTANGLPDASHVDNANMSTPPDGQAPTMQMYLFHQPGAPFGSEQGEDPFIAANGGDEADVVYHEYTHGLSNRLVVDAGGNSTLTGPQAGAMGEGWSDWYALDFLVSQRRVVDTAEAGDLRVGDYVGVGKDLIRTQPLDCPVGTTSAKCPGLQGKAGGYTYGDFGQIVGRPEVHADGEIWGETLWDLRRAIGSRAARSLVTRAMELSPANPSYLDMRNAILQADAIQGGRRNARIWRVFAKRGMGYFASAVNGDDTTTFEDFSLPPSADANRGTISGTVTDERTKAALQGTLVSVAGHASAPGFLEYLADTTDASGRYSIPGVFYGRYEDISATQPGFDTQVSPLTVRAPVTTRSYGLRRDWAASSGGASVAAFTGPDFTGFGCGPGAAIDQSLGSGWASTSVDSPGSVTVTPKYVVVRLPEAVDVGTFAVDPGATCGDAGSASTKDYRIDTAASATLPEENSPAWRRAAQGSFGTADRGRLNAVTPAVGTGAGVRFVRFTMVNPQVPGDFATTCAQGGFSGCQFMDMSELAVYGAPSS